VPPFRASWRIATKLIWDGGSERSLPCAGLGPCVPSKHPSLNPGRALTVCKIGTLSDFDNVTVRIADVAPYLAILGYRLGDEFGTSTFP
jgi:hypothetical protein